MSDENVNSETVKDVAYNQKYMFTYSEILDCITVTTNQKDRE